MLQKVKRIVISGPESSGKSTLTEQLAHHYKTGFIPEYARTYVENSKEKYKYNDVEIIARKQIEDFKNAEKKLNSRIIFFDTGLLITKVWFEYVFGKVPEFLIKALEEIIPDCCLLCYPDLPWVKDPVRENGGEVRFELFERYKEEAEKYNYKYFIVKGSGENRLNAAINFLSSAYCL